LGGEVQQELATKSSDSDFDTPIGLERIGTKERLPKGIVKSLRAQFMKAESFLGKEKLGREVF